VLESEALRTKSTSTMIGCTFEYCGYQSAMDLIQHSETGLMIHNCSGMVIVENTDSGAKAWHIRSTDLVQGSTGLLGLSFDNAGRVSGDLAAELLNLASDLVAHAGLACDNLVGVFVVGMLAEQVASNSTEESIAAGVAVTVFMAQKTCGSGTEESVFLGVMMVRHSSYNQARGCGCMMCE